MVGGPQQADGHRQQGQHQQCHGGGGQGGEVYERGKLNGYQRVEWIQINIVNESGDYQCSGPHLPQIQEEREKLLKSVEATWSPSGLGLNLCPASISTTSIPTSITSS